MSPCHLNFPVLTVAVDPRGPSSFSAPQRLSSRRRRGSAVQSVCPASAQRRVFTRFPHPVLTLAVLSCSFCTQRMNSGGGWGGAGNTPHPLCPGGNRKQTLRRAPASPSPAPCELHCLGCRPPFPMSSTQRLRLTGSTAPDSRHEPKGAGL